MTDLATLPARTLWAGVFLVLALIGAYVALDLAGLDTGRFLTFVVTVAGLAGLGAHNQRNRQMLAKIDKQTNGVLTQRIEDGVRKVLDERDQREG